MPDRRFRLLISARDAGAAGHLVEVAKAALGHPEFDTVLVTAGAAVGMFRSAGLVSRELACADGEWLELADALLAEIAPDAVLVGLSGPERGIDEALIARARIPHTYAFQDYWGDVNEGWGAQANTFFVLDEQAALLTERRIPARMVPVGNVRYAAHAAELDPLALRTEARRTLALPADAPLIGFYGQGHLDLAGYWHTVETFARTVAVALPGAHLLYRPHPNESERQRRYGRALVEATGLSFIADPLPSIERSVCACDVVATCFSSCGQIHNYLSRVAPEPMGSVMYLMFDDELVEWYRQYTRLNDIPMAELALLPSRDTLPADLRRAVSARERRRLWEKVHATLQVSTAAASPVIDTILADLRAC